MNRSSTTIYPCYRKVENALYAFMAKDYMFMISPRGSNSGNSGLTIDEYKTRNMVLKHIGMGGITITEVEFKELYTKMFTAALQKMIQ